MRKCLTSSLAGSLVLLLATFGGGVDTFKAKPNAPGKELESRTTNVPGGFSLSIEIAVRRLKKVIAFKYAVGEKTSSHTLFLNLFHCM